jgi:hypothetical protein
MRRRWGAALLFTGVLATAADYHLDCAGGNDSQDGRAPARAWRNIGHANQQPLQAGDRLLLKRGTVCAGTLSPQGSGAPGRPIVLAAYGEGATPVVDGQGFDTAIRLWNQSHWLVTDVEARGSQVYGIFAGGDQGRIEGIELRDVVARDVHGPLKTKNSGLIVVHATRQAVLDGIVIDGALAERTTQWSGILVNGASGLRPPGQEQSRRVTVRNSIVRDVWGDGIILFQLQDGRVERSAAWKTGMQPRQTIGTPNGIWTWRCERCVVSESESFWSDSPGVDGGAFDIDWGNSDNTVERSYGHDTLSYCIAVFGAGKGVTTNSVIRGNVCAGLGRSPRLARHHGAIHLYTWDGGSLDGVRIEDNIIEWHPQISEAVIRNEAVWRGAREPVLRGNVIRWVEPPKSRGGALVFHLDGSADSRGLRVLLRSARAQYAAKGLRIEERAGAPCVDFLGEDGQLVKSWQGYAPAAEVLWLVRQHVGEPSEW